MSKRKFDNIKLFKRFSQITGIPIRELYPATLLHSNYLDRVGANGMYVIPLHTIIVNPGKLTKMHWHEHRHGLQNIASSGKRKNNFRSELNVKWIEPVISDPSRDGFVQGIKNSLYDEGYIKPERLFFKWLTETLLGIKIVKSLVREKRMKDLFKKHREDGILLLWVAPPSKLDVLEVSNWERQMVKKGYLFPNGGLTKKGLHYWRRNLQTQAIWQKLAKAKVERSKAGLAIVQKKQPVRKPRRLMQRKHQPR